MTRISTTFAKGWMRLGTRFLPFADAATKELANTQQQSDAAAKTLADLQAKVQAAQQTMDAAKPQ